MGKLGPFLSACRPDSSDGGALDSLGMRAVAEHMEARDRFPGDASALNVNRRRWVGNRLVRGDPERGGRPCALWDVKPWL